MQALSSISSGEILSIHKGPLWHTYILYLTNLEAVTLNVRKSGSKLRVCFVTVLLLAVFSMASNSFLTEEHTVPDDVPSRRK